MPASGPEVCFAAAAVFKIEACRGTGSRYESEDDLRELCEKDSKPISAGPLVEYMKSRLVKKNFTGRVLLERFGQNEVK